MKPNQRKVVIIATVVVGGLLARYLSYPEDLRSLHDEWLSFAILAAAVGISAFIWVGGRR
jgi:hypothetical protein